MARDDDESQWDSDPLVRALRAPATPAELTGEADFVAAFRAQQPRGSVRRLVGRFGVGATTAVTTIALSAGVAAAYGRVLPEPVQRIAHSVLGPVGVPAPTAPKTTAPVVAPQRTATAEPGSSPSPTASATRSGGPSPTGTPDRGSAQTTQLPSATPTPTDEPTSSPTSTPTQTPPAHKVPAAVSASVSDRKVVAGSAVTVAGVVTDAEGTPLRGRVVRLLGRSAGTWTKLASGRTDRTGHITLDTTPLTRNTGLRLSTSNHVHSDLVGVLVLPVIEASAAESGGSSTITLSVLGGQPGDEITAYRRKGDGFVKVGSVTLGTDGTAVLTVPTPKHPLHVVLRLPGSKAHGKAQTSVTLGRAAATP